MEAEARQRLGGETGIVGDIAATSPKARASSGVWIVAVAEHPNIVCVP
ncbi:MAG: hypothetical protein M3071_06845 [Actinomycetota bacterium]|nr:hypothetical protein [Actinomycetota bacterium]